MNYGEDRRSKKLAHKNHRSATFEFVIAGLLFATLFPPGRLPTTEAEGVIPPRLVEVSGCESLRSESGQCIGIAYDGKFNPAPKIVVVGLDSGRTCYSPYDLPREFLGSTSRSLGWNLGKVYFCVYEKYSTIKGKLARLDLRDGSIEYGSDCLGVKNLGPTLFVVRRSPRGMQLDVRRNFQSAPGEFDSIEPIGESFAVDGRAMYSSGSGRALTMVSDMNHPVNPQVFRLDGSMDRIEGLDVLPGKVFVTVTARGEIRVFDLSGNSRTIESGAFGFRGLACNGASSPVKIKPHQEVFSSLNMSDLHGSWSSPCRNYLRQSYQVDLEFSESSVAMTERIFIGDDCLEPSRTVRTETGYHQKELTGENRIGSDFVVNLKLALTVSEVFLTVHSERGMKTGPFELIEKRLKVGRTERVTGWATAVGADFSEGFPVKGETSETWPSLPSVLKVRMRAPHAPFEIYRGSAATYEKAFTRRKAE